MEVHETCLIAPKYFWDQRRVLLMRVLLTGLLPLAHSRTLHSECARQAMNATLRPSRCQPVCQICTIVCHTGVVPARGWFPDCHDCGIECTFMLPQRLWSSFKNKAMHIPDHTTQDSLNAIHSSPSHPNSTGRRVLSPSGFGKARTITAARFDGFNANVA